MERGIVLSPQFEYQPSGGVLFRSATDDFELRKYLLYWDKIDVPKCSSIEFDCWQFQELERAGVMQRTRFGAKPKFIGMRMEQSSIINVSNFMTAEIIDCFDVTLSRQAGDEILLAHDAVFRHLDAQYAGSWSKAQISDRILTTNPVDKSGIELELYRLLPVPTIETPFDAILEFKYHHHDELLAFRCYLDELYQSILSANDIPRARNTALTKLELAIRDVNRTLKQSGINVCVDTLRSIISDTNGILGVALGAVGVASIFGADPLHAGAAGALISIAPKLIPQSTNSTPAELMYLKSVRKQFPPE
ncbi:DUF6236 family protein [Aeromonas salmonicida]|uniref:DUF6236 family protein n=1 Tax=Aeromonas salmonicida TaxID=645 RepID=UPI003417FEC1